MGEEASSAQIVSKAYAEKKLSGRCEVCGKTDWGFSEDLKYLTFSSADDDGRVIGMKQVPVALMTCRYCGNIRMHMLRVIASQSS